MSSKHMKGWMDQKVSPADTEHDRFSLSDLAASDIGQELMKIFDELNNNKLFPGECEPDMTAPEKIEREEMNELIAEASGTVQRKTAAALVKMLMKKLSAQKVDSEAQTVGDIWNHIDALNRELEEVTK